eukprot:CAMPEP_0181180012 /NCGR_PEP_ID=MMETSP1096-20121128/6568_1 /TAXON_ID=156174 ORGANISM="Chrysochromulina ericina, Strain CCMP281" /NCGR_SAMPLE_ID=MMETSP1096 /ASSEMBLY_ACC=CAM_ASM_000453 /LENGTH=97 /DNA_ID=CAMNT_0023268403 /DNA_START=146 /DNA_END=436 /DNA_ORIENTATION=+
MIARVGDHYRRHLAHRAASRPLLKFPLHLARAKLTEIAALNVRATVAPLAAYLANTASVAPSALILAANASSSATARSALTSAVLSPVRRDTGLREP